MKSRRNLNLFRVNPVREVELLDENACRNASVTLYQGILTNYRYTQGEFKLSTLLKAYDVKFAEKCICRTFLL